MPQDQQRYGTSMQGYGKAFAQAQHTISKALLHYNTVKNIQPHCP